VSSTPDVKWSEISSCRSTFGGETLAITVRLSGVCPLRYRNRLRHHIALAARTDRLIADCRLIPFFYVGCHFFIRFTLLRPMYLGRRAGTDWFRLRRFMTSDTSWLGVR